MTLGSIFLLPNGTFIAELVAFLLVLAFIAKVPLPYLRKMMNERAEAIKASMEAADEARRQAVEAADKRREDLDKARAEARQIVDQANEMAAQLQAEGRERGQQEYDRLLAAAHSEIELERQRARDEVAGELGDLVLRAAERVIGAGLDDTMHRALIEEAIAAAQPSDPEPAN